MNSNLSRWLKDDLGLRHMSEADMNNLVYHPRHGSLCRRLVKFLTESILCSKKYPNVYARDEHQSAVSECEQKEEMIRTLLSKLENQMISSRNVKSELECSTEKYQCLTKIESLLRSTTVALEEMASRPNISLFEVGNNLKNPDYLGNQSLETLYSSFASQHQKLCTSSDKITRRDLNNVNDEYQNLTRMTQLMHDSISKLLTSITGAVLDIDCSVELKKTSIDSLLALKAPACEEIVLEYDEEERHLLDQRAKLVKELRETDQQVTQLADQYSDMKAAINERFKKELEKDLIILKELQDVELKIYAR